MTSPQTSHEREPQAPSADPIDTKLEVVPLPVADVDRAKQFYVNLGWKVDADFASGEDFRVVQLTPHGSPCSIMFGKGLTTAVPGSVQGLFLIVSDIEKERATLIGQGVDVSEVFHFQHGLHVAGTEGRVPGPDPSGRSYSSYASFAESRRQRLAPPKSKLGSPEGGSAWTSRR